MRFTDVQKKEVIEMSTGKMLGYIVDAVVNKQTGYIVEFHISNSKGYSFFSREQQIINIPVKHIVSIGQDIILVRLP